MVKDIIVEADGVFSGAEAMVYLQANQVDLVISERIQEAFQVGPMGARS